MRYIALIASILALSSAPVAAQPATFPAGSTVFAVDVVNPSAILATEFHLEVDGALQPSAAAGAFTTGEFRFPPVTIPGGAHTARARACTDWGVDFGGVVCSNWTAPLTFTATVSAAPNVPDGFRVDQVIIVVGPQP